ncbi:hypothetical protein BLA29_012246 [Euroglyphus maynei]|uniref:Uncharacterized protein n=1 Tax=Euroglyphus maynei TaxID=6958 RepID=A0A1Y3BFM0_EURMA|nr:hypothetical protein BLA29_012246 [Euroglyphus maynei]
MYHMTIKHRLFGRRPSLKPLWRVMYHVITMGRTMTRKHSMDENTLIIDRVENVERRFAHHHHHHHHDHDHQRQETLGKIIGRFIRNLTNRIWQRLQQQPNHWF